MRAVVLSTFVFLSGLSVDGEGNLSFRGPWMFWPARTLAFSRGREAGGVGVGGSFQS